MIREILQKPESNALFSFVLGVALATLLFHRTQKGYVVPAVDLDKIVSSIATIDGRCYRFRVTDASEP
jgi:hypothetical protein